MRPVILNLPTFAFVVSTRAALAAGIGLLVSERLPVPTRRRVGVALVAIGAATTIPAAISVLRSVRSSRHVSAHSPVRRDERLIGATRYPRKGDDDSV